LLRPKQRQVLKGPQEPLEPRATFSWSLPNPREGVQLGVQPIERNRGTNADAAASKFHGSLIKKEHAIARRHMPTECVRYSSTIDFSRASERSHWLDTTSR
jgi:hypothetical protein